jgi:hypothetical protein
MCNNFKNNVKDPHYIRPGPALNHNVDRKPKFAIPLEGSIFFLFFQVSL